MAVLIQSPTVEYLAKVISQQDSLPSSSLVALQPRGSNPPFFCVHGVGGEVLSFVCLARHLAPDQPFYGIGAGPRGEIASSGLHIEEMATNYIEEIRTVQREGPFFLGGYSFGGSVAFEIAQQLVAQGHKVALLAILDHTPPPTRYHTAFWRPAVFLEFLRNTPYWLVDEVLNTGLDEKVSRIRVKPRL